MFWVTKFAKLGGSLKGAIKEFTKMNGRMPSSGEMNKMEAIIKNTQSNVIPFPYKRSFKDEINQMSKKGDVTLGTTLKTTPKDPIDQRWASQEEWKAKMKAQNKAALKRFEEKYGKPEDRASGGLAGQLHLNQGGRVAFSDGMNLQEQIKKLLQKGLGTIAVSKQLGVNIEEVEHIARFMKYGGARVPIDQVLERRAKGGRIGFDNGGMSRRGFLKLMGGLAALPIVGKFFKLAKPATKVMTAVEKSNAAGMPAWFPKLVDKVMKEGKDVSKQYATTERVVVKEVELPGSKTKVIVDQDLTTGDTVVDIGYGKHGFESGRYGQPVRLHLQKGEWIEPKKGQKKAIKSKDEFDVEEAEFTGEAENIKYEESVVEKYGNHGSDFSEIEKYATGKNVDKKVVGSKRVKDSWAEGYAEAQADRWADDFAKGGLAGVLRL